MFLDFINYNYKFIKDYSKKAIFLTKLTIKHIKLSWIRKEKATFKKLQQIYIAKWVSKKFNTKKLIRIKTNISYLVI